MIQRVSRQHLHFLRVSFPRQLCRPANSALHSPPSMTRSFRHRQINFLLQGSQPVRPGANQRHTLPESIIITLCANDTQRAQQVVKLCISHSNTSFRPSCYAFCRKKSKTQTQPRGTIRLPGAAAMYGNWILLDLPLHLIQQLICVDGLRGEGVILPPCPDGGSGGQASRHPLLHAGAVDGQHRLACCTQQLVDEGQCQHNSAGNGCGGDFSVHHRSVLLFDG